MTRSQGATRVADLPIRWWGRVRVRLGGGLHEVGNGVVARPRRAAPDGDREGAVGDALVAAGLTRSPRRARPRPTPRRGPPPPARTRRPRPRLDVDSPNAASARVHDCAPGAVSEVDAEAGAAAERHLAERDREPAVAHVVHAVDLARTHELGHQRVQPRRRVEVGRRAAHRRRGRARPPPTPSRRARRASRRAPRSTRRRRAAAPGNAPSSSSIKPSTPTTGVGWMSTPLDAL